MPSRRHVLATLGSVAALGSVGVVADARSTTTARRQTDGWTDQFGGSGNDEPVDSVRAHGGGAVILASGGRTVRLVAYAADGTRRWDSETTGAQRQIPAGLLRTAAGYLVAGVTENRTPWLLALDREGDRRWRQRYDIDWRRVQVEALCPRPTGGAVLGGHVDDGDPERTWTLGTTATGERRWFSTYEDVTWLTDVTPDRRGGYTVVGHVHSPTADAGSIVDAVVLGTNDRGRRRWRRTFGGNGQDRPMAVLTRPYGALIGGVRSGPDGTRSLLVAVDGRGRQIWSRSLPELGVGALVDRPAGALAVGDETIRAVDRYGRTRWRLSTDTGGLRTAAVDGRTLVTAGRTDYLGQDTGSQVWVAGEDLPSN